jgi:predicted DNA-binding transcriptional regulator AlpA
LTPQFAAWCGMKAKESLMNSDIPSHLENDRILSVQQAAALYGVSISTLRRQRHHGKLPPAIQIGVRRIGWKAGDLLAAIEARRMAA